MGMNMGMVRHQQGNLDGAMRLYHDSGCIMLAVGLLDSLDAATLLMNMGDVQRSQGDMEAAMHAYQGSWRIMKAHGTLESPSGKELLKSMGACRQQQGQGTWTGPGKRASGRV